MNTNNEFDELARQKLGEQVFPFEEAHWLDAQRMIAAKGKRRRGGALWFVAGAAVLMVGAWLLWPAEGTSVANRTEEVAVTSSEPIAPVASNVVETNADNGSQEEAVKAVEAQEVTFNEETLTASTTLDRATKDQPTTIQRNDGAEEARTSGSPTKSIETAPEATPSGTPSIRIDVVTSTAMDPDVPAADDASALDTTQDGGSEATNTSTSGAEGDPTMSVASIATTAITGGEEPTITEPAPPEALATEDTNAASNDSAATKDRGAEIAVASQAEASTTPAAVSDSATALAPNDPVTSTPQPAAIPPPIIGARAPWEIGLVGGLFNTTSTYTGGTSDMWDVDAQRTPAFGAEIMHMGRNFGIGGGLHYGTYADRLRTPEVTATSIVYTPSWYLQQVDTTILIITGSYTDTNGQVFHTGQNVNVTISQLRSTLDSSFTTVRIREASERINRTSYFEVPLLLDAHLVQGRWSLGVRGGPTVGMLTQRQGSIPSDGEGYTDFNDVAMRTWTLGWTARAYVRYRFNSAWSVGIEPAARGQLMDSFEEQGITRRSNAIGCMLSLSYRLP